MQACKHIHMDVDKKERRFSSDCINDICDLFRDSETAHPIGIHDFLLSTSDR